MSARTVWRDNGLSIVTFGLFLLFWVGMSYVGYRDEVKERQTHRAPAGSYLEYVIGGGFWQATGENWESEFLQMGLFVILTAFLRQKGSPESKALGEEEVDKDPRSTRQRRRKGAPWPVRRGGLALTVYENSLALALLALFAASFAIHAIGGATHYNKHLVEHGEPVLTLAQYVGSAHFWFESLQNWQSEFLSIGALVVLSIYLRQRGSPESKPVAAPHHETGRE